MERLAKTLQSSQDRDEAAEAVRSLIGRASSTPALLAMITCRSPKGVEASEFRHRLTEGRSRSSLTERADHDAGGSFSRALAPEDDARAHPLERRDLGASLHRLFEKR